MHPIGDLPAAQPPIPSSAVTDVGMHLVHQLLNAMCTTQCTAAIGALRDQVGAHLADPGTRDGRTEEMVLSATGLATAVLRGEAAGRGHNPAEWTVTAPPGAHRHDRGAYGAAETILNTVLNWQDARPVISTWLRTFPAGRAHGAAVDLVMEATWLARIVIANTAGPAR